MGEVGASGFRYDCINTILSFDALQGQADGNSSLAPGAPNQRFYL